MSPGAVRLPPPSDATAASNEQWQTSDTTVPYRTHNEQKTVDIADSHRHRKVLKLGKEKQRQGVWESLLSATEGPETEPLAPKNFIRSEAQMDFSEILFKCRKSSGTE